jgi:hypothetical protein
MEIKSASALQSHQRGSTDGGKIYILQDQLGSSFIVVGIYVFY